MVSVAWLEGGTYRIDAYEATNADYAAFLAAQPATDGQPDYCSFNTDFSAVDSAAGCGADWDPVARAKYPVQCIDWCDAHAFCAWAGKRLCGAVGGVPFTWPDNIEAWAVEWNLACIGGEDSTRQYPYGATYDPSACNGQDASSSSETIPVGGMPTCEGGVPGLFDMSGNVSEFVDACSGWTGPDDKCSASGGSYFWGSDTLTCNSVNRLGRSRKSSDVGFRCCAD